MQDENKMPETMEEEKEIDLLELAAKLWNQRKKLIKWSVCGAVIGLIVAFSIPKEYTTEAKLAPEISGSKTMTGGLGALASMAGVSANQAAGADAVYPMLYPDVVGSVPFLTSLFDVVVTTKGKDGEKRMLTVQEFLEDDTKSPWWSAILGAPFKLLGMLRGGDDEDAEADHKLNNFQLTKDESELVESLSKRVTASCDAKTSVITVTVQMQDPLVSALLADTVVARLQQFVTEYRTEKARKDLEYAQLLKEEARKAYYEAQERYANHVDRSQGTLLKSTQTVTERLANEAQLAFTLYNTTAQQVQKEQAKVQENTPVYAIVTPPTVPIRASSPRKAMILIGFTFLAFVACAAWILFGKPLVEEYKKKQQEEKMGKSLPES